MCIRYKLYTGPSVTGQSIPSAELYPMLDYTRVYYGLGQFIPPQAKLYTHEYQSRYQLC